ncbi:MAG: hypothetical protein PHI94_00330 [Eubacteriaceae bacterium]|nr:hypothetical protein [Eubacteriaceae bacterium]MDD4507325.1 hypothetical protein [Eubacteriaceae bacterium]
MKNRMDASDRSVSPYRGAIFSAVVLLLLFVIFCAAITGFSKTSSEEGAKRLETSVRHAVVHCYAVEGQYPSSVSYLEDHYGLTYDHQKYFIDYQGFASNVMPDITVVKLGGTS